MEEVRIHQRDTARKMGQRELLLCSLTLQLRTKRSTQNAMIMKRANITRIELIGVALDCVYDEPQGDKQRKNSMHE